MNPLPTVVAAVAVSATAVLVALLGRAGGDVSGTPRPLSGDDLKRAVLARCAYEGVADAGSLRLGPFLDAEPGEYHVVAVTGNGMLVDCALDGSSGTAGPYERAPDVKAMLAAELSVEGESEFTGYGWVSAEVARMEVVLPDGRVADAEVGGGVFVFTAEGPPPRLRVTLRAYDASGREIYERAPDDG
jgi:hypothetical protein